MRQGTIIVGVHWHLSRTHSIVIAFAAGDHGVRFHPYQMWFISNLPPRPLLPA
jgi:hypothetical protein